MSRLGPPTAGPAACSEQPPCYKLVRDCLRLISQHCAQGRTSVYRTRRYVARLRLAWGQTVWLLLQCFEPGIRPMRGPSNQWGRKSVRIKSVRRKSVWRPCTVTCPRLLLLRRPGLRVYAVSSAWARQKLALATQGGHPGGQALPCVDVG
jgi:hypothetical protein